MSKNHQIGVKKFGIFFEKEYNYDINFILLTEILCQNHKP